MEHSIELEKKFSVSAKNLYKDKVILRIVSEVKPDCDAIEVLPNLNDAYLYRIEQDE